MSFTFRASFFVIVIIILLWFFYLEREILTPFILAIIFAYLLNPVVNFLERNKLPRGLATFIILVLALSIIAYLSTTLVAKIVDQWEDLTVATKTILENSKTQISLLPPFLQNAILEPIGKVQDAVTKPQNVWPFFSGAFSSLLNIFLLIFATFYLLKDGKKIVNALVGTLPGKVYKEDARILLNKINDALGKYLRGLFTLIIIMSIVSFAGLTILGVKASLFLAILIGLAEVVPVFGPLIAGTIATLFAIFDGTSRFGLSPLYEGIIVGGGYFVLNQLENYLIVPTLMSRVTTLHPLVVLFSVIAGGNLFGILGVILAVPIVTSLRILLEYSLSKITK